VLAKNYYLTEENLGDLPDTYRNYHGVRISEIREDRKSIVFDELHRTSIIQGVRDQIVLDMREGRKWKVQVALLSQSLDDFDPIMVEFGTSIFIMDAGPEQAIKKTASVFGLSETATHALRHRVHGPREGGATFLAQFATKDGVNTQLLTCTLGSAELWAFSTTSEDANVRNQLYRKIGPVETRRVLSSLFPSGSVTRELENRMLTVKEDQGIIDEESKLSILDELVNDILAAYTKDPDVKRLV
jgi:intracellular multiplication protein IcmB